MSRPPDVANCTVSAIDAVLIPVRLRVSGCGRTTSSGRSRLDVDVMLGKARDPPQFPLNRPGRYLECSGVIAAEDQRQLLAQITAAHGPPCARDCTERAAHRVLDRDLILPFAPGSQRHEQ